MCDFPPTAALHRQAAHKVYSALRANSADHPHPGPPAQDVDVWLLVSGSLATPPPDVVGNTRARFLREIASLPEVTASDVGRLKDELFSPMYKRRRYYTGFLENETTPWNGGPFERQALQYIGELGLELPALQVRAFPSTVFHLRPHPIRDIPYSDRLPMAYDLSDWLTDGAYEIVHATKDADIWPFANTTPLGSSFNAPP